MNKIFDLLKDLSMVQSGFVSPQAFKKREITRRTQELELSLHQDIDCVHSGSINSLGIEKAENRYLLSACSDGSLYIHDLYNFTGSPRFTAKCICKIHKYHEYSHKCSIECVSWYGDDNDLFITGGTDQILKVWDSNSMKPMETFHCKGRIYQHDCTNAPTPRPIIAVASSVKNVELIDLRSGNAIHELRGHGSSVLTCHWSPSNEHILATGGIDNRILFWDVRSSNNVLRSLDQFNGDHNTGTAHCGYVNGLKFIGDGRLLLSAGTDARLRLWETNKGTNLMVNYGKVTNDVKKHLDIAICNLSSPLAFVPSEGFIYVVEILTGNTKRILHGHFNMVNCVHYRELNQELYTGGKDRNILLWTADNDIVTTYNAEDMNYEDRITHDFDSDSWSLD